jgi:hypothetical protein
MKTELSIPPDHPVPWVVFIGPVKTGLTVRAQTWFEARALGRLAARSLPLTFDEGDVKVEREGE